MTIFAPKLGGKLRHCRIALVVGTRPEAIKLSPLVRALASLGERPVLFVTGQHPGLELADHRLDGFDAIALRCPGQPDPMLHADLVRLALNRQLLEVEPQLLIVMGGTSSALGGALAARESGTALAHVEAGLRTFDFALPWPEEENRITIDRLSDLLFASTPANAANLARDGADGRIHVTGSSGIDALTELVGPLPVRRRWRPPWQPFRILVTCHRRENWGAGIDRVADAIRDLPPQARTTVLLPPNPSVSLRLTDHLSGLHGVELVPPLSHAAAIEKIRRADLLLSDSSGIVEEAAALGVPLLILRSKTERSEVLSSGSALLVGTETRLIIDTVHRLMRDRRELRKMSRPCHHYGQGQASAMMAQICVGFLREMPSIDRSSSRD